MLILKRKRNQSIIIGDDIEVKIISFEGESVKLAITAPKKISIYRKEIYDQIKEENIKAAQLPEDIKI
jgi:carbon storage regulator